MTLAALTAEQEKAYDAVDMLLRAARHRSRTVQWMPRDDRPARFEIIDVGGEWVAIVELCETGALRVRALGDADSHAFLGPASPEDQRLCTCGAGCFCRFVAADVCEGGRVEDDAARRSAEDVGW